MSERIEVVIGRPESPYVDNGDGRIQISHKQFNAFVQAIADKIVDKMAKDQDVEISKRRHDERLCSCISRLVQNGVIPDDWFINDMAVGDLEEVMGRYRERGISDVEGLMEVLDNIMYDNF